MQKGIGTTIRVLVILAFLILAAGTGYWYFFYRPPIIISISPVSGKGDTEITITGSRFTPKNNEIGVDNRAWMSGLDSPDGRIIKFKFKMSKNAFGPCGGISFLDVLFRNLFGLKRSFICPAVAIGFPGGMHKISVSNFHGTSNSVSFELLTPSADEIREIRRENRLIQAIFDDVGENYAEYCPRGMLIHADNYNFQKQKIDLNNDGLNEVIVTPLSVCKSSVRGASNNGDFIIFRYQLDRWLVSGRIFGLKFDVLDTAQNGYRNIETRSHLSAGKQQADLWQWDNNESLYRRTKSVIKE